MKRLRAAFVTGLLVLVPLLLTIQLLLWLVSTVDQNARNIIPSFLLPWDFKGLGLLVTLTLIFLTGMLTQNYVGNWLVNAFDHVIRKAPIVGGMYGSIKKFLETIFSSSHDQFHGVVLVQFPREGVFSIGFKTGKPDPRLLVEKKKHLTNVFVPCTPNPTSGFYLLVPEDELVPIDLSVQEAFKIVISMGFASDDSDHKKPPKLKK